MDNYYIVDDGKTQLLKFKKLDEFKELSDVIVVNRMTDEIKDVKDKIYTRDLYERD